MFSLGIGIHKSLRISSRRAVRSAKVMLKRTVTRTLKSGTKVGQCKCFMLPVSRILTLKTISLSKEPCLGFRTSFAMPILKAVSARVIHRFFCTISCDTTVGLRLGVLSTKGGRRVTRTLFGTFKGTLSVTMSRRPEVGRM